MGSWSKNEGGPVQLLASLGGDRQQKGRCAHHLRRPPGQESLSEQLSTRVDDSERDVREKDEDETFVEMEGVFSGRTKRAW